MAVTAGCPSQLSHPELRPRGFSATDAGLCDALLSSGEAWSSLGMTRTWSVPVLCWNLAGMAVSAEGSSLTRFRPTPAPQVQSAEGSSLTCFRPTPSPQVQSAGAEREPGLHGESSERAARQARTTEWLAYTRKSSCWSNSSSSLFSSLVLIPPICKNHFLVHCC